jgi:tRNA-specific 2-thiouridylase
MLDQATLARTLLPIGDLPKSEVRDRAAALGLRTAAKPDSQDVCFITKGGREAFLSTRLAFTPGRVVDTGGAEIGHVSAVQLVTIGQRKGLGLAGGAEPRYVLGVEGDTVTVGSHDELLTGEVVLTGVSWVDQAVDGAVLVQCSAHGEPRPASVASGVVRFATPAPRVAPGQSVVLYVGDEVVGGGLAS